MERFIRVQEEKGTLPSCPPREAHLSPTDPAGRLKYHLTGDGDGGCLRSFWKKSWRCHSCSVPETLHNKKSKGFRASSPSPAQPPIPTWRWTPAPLGAELPRAQSPDSSSLPNASCPVVTIRLQKGLRTSWGRPTHVYSSSNGQGWIP